MRAFITPEGLNPAAATRPLPQEITVADLQQAAEAGYKRFGLVTAVMDNLRRVMMLEHVGAAGTPDGSIGPLGETSQISRTTDPPKVESPIQTLSRSLWEELRVGTPQKFELLARANGSWTISRWPVGARHKDDYALAIVPILRVSENDQQQLMAGFSPTPEIRSIRFMRPQEITKAENLRPGTLEWLHTVIASGVLDTPPDQLVSIRLTDPRPLPDAEDVIFSRIGL